MNTATEVINQIVDASIGVTPDGRLSDVGPGLRQIAAAAQARSGLLVAADPAAAAVVERFGQLVELLASAYRATLDSVFDEADERGDTVGVIPVQALYAAAHAELLRVAAGVTRQARGRYAAPSFDELAAGLRAAVIEASTQDAIAVRVDVEWCLVHDALLHGGHDRCVDAERGDGAKSFVRCASVALHYDRAEAARRSNDWQRTQSGRTRR